MSYIFLLPTWGAQGRCRTLGRGRSGQGRRSDWTASSPTWKWPC